MTLTRRHPLKRRAVLKSRSRRQPATPERMAWKEPHAGFCECGCGRFSMHLEHHHIVAAERLRQESREDVMWDPRNGMYLVPTPCHSDHTSAKRRIAIEALRDESLAFAVDVLGEGPAAEYFRRYYRCDETLGRAA